MSNTVWIVFGVGGGALAAVSLLADALGIGAPGFGLKQTAGLVVGLIAAVVGASGWMRSR